jgi:hypothetical protein
LPIKLAATISPHVLPATPRQARQLTTARPHLRQCCPLPLDAELKMLPAFLYAYSLPCRGHRYPDWQREQPREHEHFSSSRPHPLCPHFMMCFFLSSSQFGPDADIAGRSLEENRADPQWKVLYVRQDAWLPFG